MSHPRRATPAFCALVCMFIWGGCSSSTTATPTTLDPKEQTIADANVVAIGTASPIPYAIADEEEQLVQINVCSVSCFEDNDGQETLWLRQGEVHRIHFTTGGAFSAFDFPIAHSGEPNITWRAGHSGSIVINGETVGVILQGDAAMYPVQPPDSLSDSLGNITVRALHNLTPEMARIIERLSTDELVLSLQFESGPELDLAALQPLATKIRHLHIAVRAPRVAFDLTKLPPFPHMHSLAIVDEYGDLGLTNASLLAQQGNLSSLELSGVVLDAEELADLSGLSQLTELTLSTVDSERNPVVPRFEGLSHLRRLSLNAGSHADDALEAIRNLNLLQVLELRGGVSDRGLGHLATHENLHRLRINIDGVTRSGAAHMGAVVNLADLEVEITGDDEVALSHIGNLRSLRSLTITSESLSDAGAAHLASLPGLERLDLDDTGLTDAGLSHISGLTNLRRLSLARTSVSDAGLAHLSRLTHLETLVLDATSVGDSGMIHLRGLDTLQRLSLVRTSVGDTGLEHLSRLASLREVYLGVTGITDDGLAHLRRLDNLVVLNLSSTAITDIGVQHLSTLSTVRALDLSLTRITGTALAHLSNLANLRRLLIIGTEVESSDLLHLDSLQHLWLLQMQYSAVTIDEAEAYQARHPARYVWY